MALINTIIPAQAFELIRDRIGEILALEVHNQKVLLNDAEDATIWCERIVPFDKTELPAINVSIDRGDFSGQTVKQASGKYFYNIDIYTNAKSSAGGAGDKKSMLKMQRLIGLCRAILEDTQYVRLGFTPPFISSRRVNGFKILNQNNEDSLSTSIGRLILEVNATETVDLLEGAILQLGTTKVKIEETEKGYQYILSN